MDVFTQVCKIIYICKKYIFNIVITLQVLKNIVILTQVGKAGSLLTLQTSIPVHSSKMHHCGVRDRKDVNARLIRLL
jgi:hypothetical protein